MKCLICSAKDTRVLDSRLTNDGMSIRRRRECVKCRFRFSTIEDIHLLDLTVLKRDGRRDPYSREKLARGLARALEKRPVTSEQERNLIRAIEGAIQKLRSPEVTTRDIGEIVMRQLQKFDHIAYIRFASVYRQFEDVRTFQRELAQLTASRKKRPARRSSRKKKK